MFRLLIVCAELGVIKAEGLENPNRGWTVPELDSLVPDEHTTYFWICYKSKVYASPSWKSFMPRAWRIPRTNSGAFNFGEKYHSAKEEGLHHMMPYFTKCVLGVWRCQILRQIMPVLACILDCCNDDVTGSKSTQQSTCACIRHITIICLSLCTHSLLIRKAKKSKVK